MRRWANVSWLLVSGCYLQHGHHSTVPSQNAVYAYFTTKQILPFGFGEQHCTLDHLLIPGSIYSVSGILLTSADCPGSPSMTLQVMVSTACCQPLTRRVTQFTPSIFSNHTQQTLYVEPVLVRCWPIVYDSGPTSNHTGSTSGVCWVCFPHTAA